MSTSVSDGTSLDPSAPADPGRTPESARPAHPWRITLARLGVLPFLLVIALATFALMSEQFLTLSNLTNLLRQSVYLILVACGQMLALVTGGFDLSVGTILAVTSVVAAMAMKLLLPVLPDAAWLAILLGCLIGIAAGALVGVINGIGIAYLNVPPFIMTLGVQSIGFGVALMLTGGVPVADLPDAFGDVFGFGRWLGVPVPVVLTAVCVVALYVLFNRTASGTHLYAVGGNSKAARLSGIDTRRVLLGAYVLCALLTALAGILLTARTNSGEANIGGTVALESIAACVIGGVSLRGGNGRLGNVVLGAIFINLIQNGMNLADIGSYAQTIVLGVLLVLAVVADQVRHRYLFGQR